MALMGWAAHMLQVGVQLRRCCKAELNTKAPSCTDRVLKFAHVKVESLVTAYQHGAVNLNRALYKLPVTRWKGSCWKRGVTAILLLKWPVYFVKVWCLTGVKS